MAVHSKENGGCGAAAERANFLCLSAVRKCSWSRSTEVTVFGEVSCMHTPSRFSSPATRHEATKQGKI